MNINSAQLLRMLGSGVQPITGGASPSASNTAAPVSFANLLQQARDGSLTSAAPVSLASDSGVTCSPDQLARLSLGADKLEAAGVRTALVNIDGQQLVMDVHQRQIIGNAKSQDGLISGIDGVIDLGDARSASAAGGSGAATGQAGAGAALSAGTAGAIPAPNALASKNQSLLKLLADVSAA
jgi:hypothetical protein